MKGSNWYIWRPQLFPTWYYLLAYNYESINYNVSCTCSITSEINCHTFTCKTLSTQQTQSKHGKHIHQKQFYLSMAGLPTITSTALTRTTYATNWNSNMNNILRVKELVPPSFHDTNTNLPSFPSSPSINLLLIPSLFLPMFCYHVAPKPLQPWTNFPCHVLFSFLSPHIHLEGLT